MAIGHYKCRVDNEVVKVKFNDRGMAKRPKCPKCGGAMSLKDTDIKPDEE